MWADRPTEAKRGEIEAAEAMNPSFSPFLSFSHLIFVWHRATAIHYVDQPRAKEMIEYGCRRTLFGGAPHLQGV